MLKSVYKLSYQIPLDNLTLQKVILPILSTSQNYNIQHNKIIYYNK